MPPRRSHTLDGLLLTDTHKEVARGNKAIGFVRMSPNRFLFLTTPSLRAQAEIREEAKPLEAYNEWSRVGETLNSPFLRIDRETGQVCGHEGRHRAAALDKAEPGEPMDVAVVLKDRGCGTSRYYEERPKPGSYYRQKRYLGKDDVPTQLCNEYDEKICAPIDLSSWHGLYAEEETRWKEDLAGAAPPRAGWKGSTVALALAGVAAAAGGLWLTIKLLR